MDNILFENNLYDHLMKLCIDFEWCSILHLKIEEIVREVLKTNALRLIEESRLVDYIIYYADADDFCFPTSRNLCRRGYKSTLLKIANDLISEPSITNILRSNREWANFQ
jgi:hypothetical protein